MISYRMLSLKLLKAIQTVLSSSKINSIWSITRNMKNYNHWHPKAFSRGRLERKNLLLYKSIENNTFSLQKVDNIPDLEWLWEFTGFCVYDIIKSGTSVLKRSWNSFFACWSILESHLKSTKVSTKIRSWVRWQLN